MPRADCKMCDGSGELLITTRPDENGEPEEVWARCECVDKEPFEE